MIISYWGCKFSDYEDYWGEGMEDEYRSYGCSNKKNCLGQCEVDNKWGRDRAECPMAELDT